MCITIIGALEVVSSSSSISRSISLAALPCCEVVPSYDVHSVVRAYSLNDIASELNLDAADLHDKLVGKGWKKTNDIIACECIWAICKRIPFPLKVVADSELTGLNELSPIIASCKQRPDIAICFEDEDNVVFTGEVHSSPFSETITKACIGGVNFFRLLRAQGIDITDISTFSLPRCNYNTCLTEITISFSDFLFSIQLTKYRDLHEGLSRLQEVITNQCKLLSAKSRNPIDRHFIKLSNEECRALCGNEEYTQIVSSTHIVVQTSNIVCKVLYADQERYSFCQYCLILRELDRHPTDLIISPRTVTKRGKVVVYEYAKVKFSPMNVEYASKCLKALVKSIKAALDELHGLGFSHNDIRLPNICFDSKYQAVLIDLDRVTILSENFYMFYSQDSDSSCMYRIPFSGSKPYDGRNTDYMQLGWLVAWVIDHSGRQHNRKWETQEKKIKDNRFIYHLIHEGEYKDELLEQCFEDGQTLKTVLDQQ